MNKLYLAGVLSALLIVIYGLKATPVSFRPPEVAAAPAQTVVLPVESVALRGTGTLAVDYIWSQVAGPNVVAIANRRDPTTHVSGLKAGTYVFELFATDSKGATGTAFDTIQVTGPDLSAVY
jgi:hypothetical protein